MILEKNIEDEIRQRLGLLGLKTVRVERLSCRGWPDVQVMGEGRIVLVEVKRPGGSCSPQQIQCHNELRQYGMDVVVGDDPDVVVAEVVGIFKMWGVL